MATTSGPAERRRAARRIAEVLLGIPLAPIGEGEAIVRAPYAPSTRPEIRAGPKPITYVAAANTKEPQFWQQLLEGGEAKTRRRGGDVLTMAEMEGDLKRRQPATIHVRGGIGGKQPRFESTTAHAIAGLEDFGEISWLRVSKRADLGTILLDPNGNTLIAHRLSGADVRDGETFINQLVPNLALVDVNKEVLRPRLLLFALHMQGTREVRQDRFVPVPSAAEYGERDDINLILDAIHAGWCEHVVYRDGGRVARDVLPGEMIIAHLRKSGTGLWLADSWKRLDYRRDRLALRAGNMVSAETRDNLVTSMTRGLYTKGVLAGKGWTSSSRFGFYRHPRTKDLIQDMEQWPYIRRAFDLAATGDYQERGGGLSTRALADQLAAENCPIDHDRLRTLLKDEIYATGNHTANARGIPIAQEPVKLVDPVPLETFQRVQMLLSVRQGSTKRTPLGEFLLNYVHTEHEPCHEHRDKQGRRPSIKGYVNNRNPDAPRRYRHNYTTPPQCRRCTWAREELEHPIVEKVRELAQDRMLVEQLVLAERHASAVRPAFLSEQERADIEREIAELEAKLDAMTEQFVIDMTKQSGDPVERFSRLIEATQKRRDGLKRRLKADHERQHAQSDERLVAVHERRLEAFLEIMTLDPPNDDYLRALRARLFVLCVSAVRIGYDEDGLEWIEIHGPLVPDATTDATAVHPIARCADLLDQHLRGEPVTSELREAEAGGETGGTGGTEGAGAAEGHGQGETQTDLPLNSTKSVCVSGGSPSQVPYKAAPSAEELLDMPTGDALRRRQNDQLEATVWGRNAGRSPVEWVPAWRVRLPSGPPSRRRRTPIAPWERARQSILRAQAAYEAGHGESKTGGLVREAGSSLDGQISAPGQHISCAAYQRLREARPDLELLSRSQLRNLAMAHGQPHTWAELVVVVCEGRADGGQSG